MDWERVRTVVFETCALEAARPVMVGVSGGPDSLALLHSLHRLGLPVLAAHFNHQLRVEAAADAEFVRAQAAALGVPFVHGTANVAEVARQSRESIETTARALRYQFLFAQARAAGAQAVAVGHTLNDQAETVLLHLLRGAGLNGLAGMRHCAVLPEWDAVIPLVRPLLDVDRTDILAYCQEHNLQPRIDATNTDPSYTRNRIRMELMPVLASYNPQIQHALARLAETAAGQADIARDAVETAWSACLLQAGADWIDLNRQAVLALTSPLRRAVLRKAASALQPQGGMVDFGAVRRAEQWVLRGSRGEIDLAGGVRLFLEEEIVCIAASGASPIHRWPQLLPGAVMELPVPGVLELPGGWRLEARRAAPLERSLERSDAWEAWLDEDQLAGPLRVRTPQPGDRFQPLGMDGHSVKLSDAFVNHKTPRRARAAWPVVTGGAQIVWLAGIRTAHPVRITGETQRVIHLQLYPP